MNSSPKKLIFQKLIHIYISETLTFKDFKEYNMKKKEKECDNDFNERCKAVWTKLCEKQKSQGGCIQVEEEDRYDGDNEDCEAEIEEMIEEAVEEVDKENEC